MTSDPYFGKSRNTIPLASFNLPNPNLFFNQIFGGRRLISSPFGFGQGYGGYGQGGYGGYGQSYGGYGQSYGYGNNYPSFGGGYGGYSPSYGGYGQQQSYYPSPMPSYGSYGGYSS